MRRRLLVERNEAPHLRSGADRAKLRAAGRSIMVRNWKVERTRSVVADHLDAERGWILSTPSVSRMPQRVAQRAHGTCVTSASSPW